MVGPSFPSGLQSLASSPLYSTLKVDLVQAVHEKATAAVPRDPNFSLVAQATAQIQGSLQTLGKREFADAFRGCNVLHQVRFSMLDAADFCDQYGKPAGLLFYEPYVTQCRRVVARLQALAGLLAKVAANEALTTLPKHDGLREAPLTAPPLTPPDGARSIQDFLTDDAKGVPRRILLKAAAGQWLDVESVIRAAPEQVTEKGVQCNLLHMAVLWQSPHAAALFLGLGLPPDSLTGEGGADVLPSHATPLHLAALVGSPAMARLLLAWGADPMIRNSRGALPQEVPTNDGCRQVFGRAAELREHAVALCSAAHKGQGPRLHELINQQNLPLDIKYNAESRFFLLHHIVHCNDADTLTLALEAGASPLLRTKDGLLPSGVAKSSAGRVAPLVLAAEAAETTLLTAPIPPPTPKAKVPAPLLTVPASADGDGSRASRLSPFRGRDAVERARSPNGGNLPVSPRVAISESLHGASRMMKKGVDRVRRGSHCGADPNSPGQ